MGSLLWCPQCFRSCRYEVYGIKSCLLCQILLIQVKWRYSISVNVGIIKLPSFSRQLSYNILKHEYPPVLSRSSSELMKSLLSEMSVFSEHCLMLLNNDICMVNYIITCSLSEKTFMESVLHKHFIDFCMALVCCILKEYSPYSLLFYVQKTSFDWVFYEIWQMWAIWMGLPSHSPIV